MESPFQQTQSSKAAPTGKQWLQLRSPPIQLIDFALFRLPSELAVGIAVGPRERDSSTLAAVPSEHRIAHRKGALAEATNKQAI